MDSNSSKSNSYTPYQYRPEPYNPPVEEVVEEAPADSVYYDDWEVHTE